MLSPWGQSGQNFGLCLKALALASASASNIWPRPGLGLQQKNQQSRRDWPVCLPTTGRHTLIHVEGSYCDRENDKLNYVVLIIMIWIHLYAVNHHLILFIHNFIFGLGLGLNLRNWPRPRPWPQSPGLGLGLRTLASKFWPRLTSLAVNELRIILISCCYNVPAELLVRHKWHWVLLESNIWLIRSP